MSTPRAGGSGRVAKALGAGGSGLAASAPGAGGSNLDASAPGAGGSNLDASASGGDGPTPAHRAWVLLHGFTGAPAAWDTVSGALSAHGQVLCPALVGHAPQAGKGAGFDAEVDRLAALIRAWGAPCPHLCGYSLGARVAMGLLVRHPDLFGGATLIGGHPGLDADSAERAVRAQSDERWARLAETDVDDFLAQWRAQPIFATQASLDEARRDRQDRLRARHDGDGLAAGMRALSLSVMPDWKPHLHAIPFPVHLMVGALDAKFVELSRAMLPRLARGRLSVVPGVGHNVLLERPDAVIDALLSA